MNRARAAAAAFLAALFMLAGIGAASADPPSGGDNYDIKRTCNIYRISDSGLIGSVEVTVNIDDYSTTTQSGYIDYIVLRSPVGLQYNGADSPGTVWKTYRVNGTTQTGANWANVSTGTGSRPFAYRVDPNITTVWKTSVDVTAGGADVTGCNFSNMYTYTAV